MPEARVVLASEVAWERHPALPPGAELAVVAGNERQPGPLVLRVRVPPRHTVPLHAHPDDRIYTVLEGSCWWSAVDGAGRTSPFRELRAGSVIVLPGGVAHAQRSEGEGYLLEIVGRGPTGTEYVHPEDDPRRRPAPGPSSP
ncbi:MAG: cupin domain-containing protein [Thermoplasmata archaeon]